VQASVKKRLDMAQVRSISCLNVLKIVDGGVEVLRVVTMNVNSPRNLAQVHASKLYRGTPCSIPCQSEPTSEGAPCRARDPVHGRQQVAS
jgi:hypothetical protein